jgi:RNA polymerase sigma factor (TIGR02999 family)
MEEAVRFVAVAPHSSPLHGFFSHTRSELRKWLIWSNNAVDFGRKRTYASGHSTLIAVRTDRDDHVTTLLGQWRAGSSQAGQRLVVAVQRELRQLAAAYLRRERPGHTLQPTALVNEAYIRLVGQRRVHWQNRTHFYGIAAQAMRRVLVDYARRRRAAKRDGMTSEPLTLSGMPDPRGAQDIEVLALHEALTDLAALDSRQAQIVELRYFGGLTIDEIAQAQTISQATVKRELATAKLWLRHHMQRQSAVQGETRS